MRFSSESPLNAELEVFQGDAAKLAEWGWVAADFDCETTVVQLFEAQARRNPDAMAVSDAVNTLTYAELDAKAGRLACLLAGKGVKADVPVGLSMERSLDMAVGILGILKAGGAYVPLDPDYPRERLNFIMEDTAMPVIVTQSSLQGELSGSAAELICADTLDEALPVYDGEHPAPGSLAYLIYTSGSTGKPKGVMVEHRSLVNHCLSSVERYGMTPGDRMLQFISINFDGSVEEIFPTWAVGATLVLRTEMLASSITLFEQFIEDQQITVVDLPTAYWHEWVRSARKLPESLRAVIVGGEKASRELVKKWKTLGDGEIRWFNVYGPTETTSCSTVYELDDQFETYKEIPIGRPVANTALFVVDDNMRLVAPGEEGELLIGGAGVARGYLNRDRLTEERFVDNPWGGGRLYHTGDRVRWLPDGNLDFIGRIDFQVKIRGFRIEPDEVAAVLERHGAVGSAVVVARDDIAEQKALAAYVICSQDVSHAELAEFLALELPEYMVPAAFQTLEEFPMTPGGKVDRRALPKPVSEPAATEETGEAPRSGLEETIASIWCDVLGLEQVGLHDNFFELGGYSLLIIRIASRLKEEGVDVKPQLLFQYQTVSELAGQLGGAAETEAAAPGIKLERTVAEAEFPLSQVEQRFWLTAQLGAVSPMVIPVALRIRGELDVELLQRCMQELVRRQDMLRSSYRLAGDDAVRVVTESCNISLAVQDIRADADKLENLIGAVLREPFDFKTGPLWRMKVYRTGDAEYTILMAAHHIIFDGWSVTIFIRELQALYEAFGAGQASPLPELKIRYGDYAAWQQKTLAAAEMEEHSNYWKNKLENFQTLEFPFDRPRPAEQTYNGGMHPFAIPATLAARLEQLSREKDTTLFMTLLAAFKLLLARYCGQEDIVIGTPVALRPTADTEAIIGLFLNTVVLRTDLSGNASFSELLERVKQTALEAFAHQDMPFDRLVDLLAIPRDVSLTPLYQVIFSMNNYPVPPMTLGTMEMTDESVNAGMTDVDLGISIDADEQGLRGTIDFNTDLLDAASVAGLAEHFLNVLAAVCEDPGLHLADVPLLSETERHRMLKEWNDTATNDPLNTCTHRLIEEQAAKVPDKTAILFGDEQVTYAQMNARANRLAHRLIEQGVKPDDRVGLCLERGPNLIIAELAIWKAGGAYVPLDPIYPPERIAYMLADSNAALLITERSIQSVTPHTSRITLDEIDLSAYPETNPDPAVSPSNLAYVIYTSGSTGNPKGVEIEHRSFLNFLLSMQQTLRLTPEDTVLAITTPCFDIAGLELHLAPITGARVSILTREEALDGHRIAEQIEKNGTVLQATPATWRILLESGWQGADHLKMICGGEHWSRELADALLQGGGELWNMYGPTETTVTASAEQVFAGGEGAIPIGKPIANVSLYILDTNMQPVPAGVPGELWIGGAGLARGYCGQSELTAEVFTDDPFSQEPGARMYKTGDLAKWLPDGRVECLGRVDSQVKVRGFRIELEEIEKSMERHPAVKQAVADVYQAADGTNRLAGYFQCLENQSVELSSLRNQLKENLPEYMIPSAFVELEQIPLTASGKTDRKALPEPGVTALASSTEYVAPRNKLERALAAAWSAVLKRDEIGINDNFFELGGHSLLLVQVMNKASELGVELSIQQIFRHQTVAELAAAIGGEDFQTLEKTDSGFPMIGRLAEESRFPVSFTERRFWFLSQFHDGASIYNIVWGYTIYGELDVKLFESCVNSIVRRHDVLRSTYTFEHDEPLRVVAGFAPVEVPLVDARGRVEEIRPQQREEAAAPIDIGKGPLWNVKLYRTADAEYEMIWKIHHIIADGWSGGNFMSELQELYSAAVADRPAQLPELKIRYGDYAAWQRAQFEDGRLDALSRYWKNKLQNFQTLELPLDRPRAAARSTQGEVVLYDIEKPLAHLIKRRSQDEDVTPFMTLLAAFKVMLARYSGQEDIVIGTPVANRSPAETEPVIGLFLNNVVLRTDVASNITFRELLQRVKQTAMGAFAHQELSFERVVELLNVERDTSLPPLYQVMLSLNNYPYPQLKLGELETQEAEVDNGLAQTDMWFVVDDDELGMRGSVSYNSDLFDRATIERMVEHFLNILQSGCANPSQTVSEIPLFSDTERRRMLVDWNATETDYPRGSCTHQLIEAQAAATPDAPAILFEGEEISYAEMNARANRLAHLLIEKGVKAESKVCVCLERGPELVIAELAIWKAGGAYVPLDPIYPPERIAYMLADSNAELLITERSIQSVTPHTSRITLDEIDLSACPGTNPSVEVSPDNLAYMIYTSGSTGNPKGVQIEHRPFVNFLLSMQREPGLQPGDTLLAITTPCFDIAGLELYLPLITGARVAILPQETVMSGQRLAEEIEKTGTVLQATPATWRMLLDSGWQGANHLKMMCGGEGWPRELANALLEGGGELWNMYGPTETTVWSSIEQVRRGDEGSISIGRPIANTSLYILDDGLQPVPVGVTGELWIGGEGLSRGYYKRDELSAERFVTDPFSKMADAKMYKTGDLAKWLPDGRIECLGRVDFQVKVRGFRIELEEIEKVMERHAGVKQAVANAYMGPDGNNQLAGYFQCLENAEVEVSSLRNLLKESLPDYMVPLSFMKLDEIPLTPNGKVDRKALPDPDTASAGGSGDCVEPRTPDERALAQIWREVLNLERVGVRDNFFDLGGHSLLAIRLIDRLAESGYTLRVEQLFQYPNIEEMVTAINTNFAVDSEDPKWSSLVTLKRGNENNTPLFFMHTAPGDVLMYANLIHHLRNDQPCYGFQSLGLHDLENMHASIPAMAAHYVQLLTEFYPSGPYMLAGWCYGGTIAQEMAVQMKEQGREVILLALFDAWAHAPEDRELRRQYNQQRRKAFMTLGFGAQRDLILNRILNRLFAMKKAGVKQELEVEITRGTLKNRDRVYKLNMEADWNHYARYYSGKLSLFRPDLLNPRFLPDLSMGWHSLADEYEVFLIPGGHRSLMHEPNAQSLAMHLQACMDRVLAN